MTIHAAAPIAGLKGLNGEDPPSAAGGPAAAPADLASQQVFLQLLVAQLKNQNPLSPSDPMEFVSQLTQFSALEQTIAMRQSLDTIRDALTAAPESAAGGSVQS